MKTRILWSLLLGIGVGLLLQSKRRVGEPTGKLRRIYGDGERDKVEESSWESFPASDPPAW